MVDWNGSSAVWAEPLPPYEQFRSARRTATTGLKPIDPRATATAILALADAAEPSLRLFLGTYPYPLAEKAYTQRLHTWRQWHQLAASADGSPSETAR